MREGEWPEGEGGGERRRAPWRPTIKLDVKRGPIDDRAALQPMGAPMGCEGKTSKVSPALVLLGVGLQLRGSSFPLDPRPCA